MVGFYVILIVIIAVIVIAKKQQEKQYKETDYYIQTGADYGTVKRDKGKLGEYLTYQYLKPLEGYKRYLFNLYIPKENGETTELDVILLHESGIYVFESKNYSGWIFGTETQQKWTQSLSVGRGKTQKEHFLNPVIQNKVHLKWLRNYLKDDSLPFYSYIVFSDRCKLKEINLTSGEHFVIKRCDILKAVQRNAEKAGNNLTQEKIDSLYEKLLPLTKVDETAKLEHIENIRQRHGRTISDVHIGNICEQTTDRSGSQVSVAEPFEQPAVTDISEHTEQEKTPQAESQETEQQVCPICGGKLILRTARKGERKGKQFWGCSNYPKCRYIQNI